jgi:hypothetical protein
VREYRIASHFFERGTPSMSRDFNRRDFHRPTAAAVGGILAGSTLGCGKDEKPKATKAPGGANTKHGVDDKESPAKGEAQAAVNDWLGDTHVCRGLNACKGKGADGKNDCAGKGTCFTPSIAHGCGGQNNCKFQGGCGTTAGQNECKQKGGCHLPLMEDAWKGARAAFDSAMKKAGKTAGDAPAAK